MKIITRIFQIAQVSPSLSRVRHSTTNFLIKCFISLPFPSLLYERQNNLIVKRQMAPECLWNFQLVSTERLILAFRLCFYFFTAMMTFAMAQRIYCHLLLRTWFASTSFSACFLLLIPLETSSRKRNKKKENDSRRERIGLGCFCNEDNW